MIKQIGQGQTLKTDFWSEYRNTPQFILLSWLWYIDNLKIKNRVKENNAVVINGLMIAWIKPEIFKIYLIELA